MQVSSCRSIAPRWLARMPVRSHSIELLKILAPAPSGPRRLASGRKQSSRMTSAIGDVRKPSFSMSRLTRNPGGPRPTRNAATPPPPRAGQERRQGARLLLRAGESEDGHLDRPHLRVDGEDQAVVAAAVAEA